MTLKEKIYMYSPIWLQNIFVSLEGKKRWKQRISNAYYKKWKILSDKLEKQSNKKVLEFQENMLSSYIEKAYNNSIFWNIKLKEYGYKQGQKITLDDLKDLPLTNKEIMKKDKNLFFNMQQKENDYINVHTSGTTGSGFNFRWSNEANAATFSLFWNLCFLYNTLGDKYGTFNGNVVVPLKQKKPPFWRFNRPMNQTIFSIFHMSEENLFHYVKEIQNGKYKFFNGYPSAIFQLARFINDYKIKIPKPKAIYTSSETLLKHQREEIEKAFGARVYDVYGNGEQSMMAYQCEEGNYHVVPYYSAVWFKKSGFYDGNEELYEPIGTSFINDSTFFINYSTNDLVKLRGDYNCPCGRKGKIIKSIIGRMDDFIITPDGRKIGRLDHLFKDSEDVKEAQIVQDRIDHLLIKIVLYNGNNFLSKKSVLNKLRSRIGREMQVEFKIVKRIEKTNAGKFRAVISRISENIKDKKAKRE